MKVKLYKLLVLHYERTREHASDSTQAQIDGLLNVKRENKLTGNGRASGRRKLKEIQDAAKRRLQARLLATMDRQQALSYMSAQNPRLKPENVRRWVEWSQLGLDYPLSHTRKRPGPEVVKELKDYLSEAHGISLPASGQERQEERKEVQPSQVVHSYAPEWEE